jgi:hypothetical protein
MVSKSSLGRSKRFIAVYDLVFSLRIVDFLLEYQVEIDVYGWNSASHMLREAPDVGNFANAARTACGTDTTILGADLPWNVSQ